MKSVSLNKMETNLTSLRIFGDICLISIFLVWSAALIQNPLHHFTDDALFYLQIAHNFSNGEGLSFGMNIPTNGFHPFWMTICIFLSYISDSKSTLINYAAYTNILLNASTLFLIRNYFVLQKKISISNIGLLIGVPYFLYAGVGMESSIAMLCYVSFLLLSINYLNSRRIPTLIWCSLFAGLTVFSRLDLAIMILPIVFFLAFHLMVDIKKSPKLFISILFITLLGLIAPLSWLIFNQIVFGHIVPISGMLKLNINDGLNINYLTGVNLIHIIIVTFLVVFISFTAKENTHKILIAAGIGQIIYFANLAYSGQSEVYSWYFIPYALLASIMLSVSIDIVFNKTEPGFAKITHKNFAILVNLFALSLCISSSFLANKYSNRVLIDLSVNESNESEISLFDYNDIKRVFVFDKPGILSFIDGYSVIAADGLTSNIRFQEELKINGFNWLIKNYELDAFIGPKASGPWIPNICNTLYLNSMIIRCSEDFQFSAIEFYSRIDGSYLGDLLVSELEVLSFNPERNIVIYKFKK